MRGKIISTSKRGFGFISSKEMPFTKVFFHWVALSSNSPKFTELKSGMEVEFDAIEYQDKGWRAVRVYVIEDMEMKEANVERIK